MFNEVIAILMTGALIIGLSPIMIEMIMDYWPKRKIANPSDYERFQ